MKLAFQATVLMLVSTGLLATCEKGTLRCNTASDPPTPEVCDFLDSYVLNIDTKKCEQKIIEGCELPAFNDASMPCFICEKGKVFDVHNAKCIAVTTAIANCERYSASDSSCLSCAANFLLESGKCTGVTTAVANCGLYSSLTECLSCAKGFYLKDKACVGFTSQSNCMIHTDRICDTCQNGSLHTPSYLNQTTATDTLFQLVVTQTVLANTWAPSTNKTVCPLTIVSNCMTHQTFNKCSKCNAGYFVNTKWQCEKNPEDPIPNCELYSNLTTCVKCKGVYFLNGGSVACSKATQVVNCKSYKATKNECGECDATHYLDDPNNTCILRNHPKIDNCVNLDIYKDQCLLCDSGTTASLDNARCYQNISNCLNLSRAASFSISQHTCLVCHLTHYLETNACKLRTVPGCKTYKMNSDKCEVCEGADTYLSTSNKCESLTQVHCAKYYDNSNNCERCNDNYHNSNGGCVINSVEHCTSYIVNTNSCTSCIAGYYSTADECRLQNVTHCEVYQTNLNRCQTCHINYYPPTDAQGTGLTCAVQSLSNCVGFHANTNNCSKCALAFSWNGSACASNSKDYCTNYTVHEDTCTSCALGYYATAGGCSQQVLAGCIQFAANLLECTNCAKGYYRTSTTCVPQSVDHCIIYVADTGNCNKCSAGHWKATDTSCLAQNIPNCVHHYENINECDKCAAGTWKKSNTVCESLDVDDCIDYNMSTGKCTTCSKGYWLNTSANTCTQENVTNCIKYSADGTCAVCPQYTLRAANGSSCTALSITNCVEYNMTTGVCSLCAKGTFKSPDSTACSTNNRPGCIQYNADGTCNTCELGKYPSSGGCVSVSKSNCILYTANTNTCVTCDVNYYETGGSCVLKNVDNCIEYTNSTTANCLTCAVGYYVHSVSECKKIVTKENCVAYNLANGVCSKCDFGYWLNTPDCAARDKTNCIKYVGDTNNCEVCEIKYFVSNHFCKLQDKSNCIDFTDNANTCTTCKKGYYKDGGDLCQQNNKPNCIEYNADGTCSVCKMGWWANAGNCTAQAIAGCIKYNANVDQCSKCEPDYFKSGNTCTIRSVTGCIEYTADSNDCVVCANNYHKASVSSCVIKNTAFCLEYAAAVCTKCAKKKYLDPSKACQDQVVANCAAFTDNANECTTCGLDFYRKSATECAAVDKTNCIVYTANTNTCVTCAAGSYLHGDGTCKAQDSISGCVEYVDNSVTCSKCQLGKYKHASLNQCDTQSVSNCISYKFNENKCAICEAGYFKNSSDTCAQQNVSHCIEYTPNSEVCRECAGGYYLKYTSGATPPFSCAVGAITNCIDYDANANRCNTCDQRYYLNGVACTEREGWDDNPAAGPAPNVTGCINWKTAANTDQECLACAQLLKLATNQNLCEPNTYTGLMLNCRIHNTTTPTECDTCAVGYKIDSSTTCEAVTPITNCTEYVEGKQECNKCSTKYKPSSDKTSCIDNTIQNCSHYVANDTTTCATCDNLYYLTNSAKDCTQVASFANCFQSNGTTDACIKCKKEYFNPAAACATSRTASYVDAQCAYNTETTDLPLCNSCASGYFKVNAAPRAISATTLGTTNKCIELLHTDAAVKCDQCKDWHTLNTTTGVCTEQTADKLTYYCKRKVNTNATALTDAATCQTCSYSNLYYNNSGTCTSRGDLANAPNCEVYNSTSAACSVCAATFSPQALGYVSSCAAALTTGATAVTNCKTYSVIDTTSSCLHCEQGYNRASSTSCVHLKSHTGGAGTPTNYEFIRGYGANLEPVASVELAVFANCEKFTQIAAGNGAGSIGCSKCATNFVGIVSYNTADHSTALPAGFAHQDNSHSGKYEVVNTFIECVATATSYLKDDGATKMTATGKCAVGYKDGSIAGFACLKCINGDVGKIGVVTKHTGGNLSGSLLAVGGCTDASATIERKYHFMHYRYRDKDAALRWNNFLNFDSCKYTASGTPANDLRNLVYMAYQDTTNGHLTHSSTKDIASGSNADIVKAFCLADARFTASNLIANCQFYLLDGDVGATINSTSVVFTVTCGMCSPGFYPDNFTGKITSCSAISSTDCDVSNPLTNLWMNACNLPQNIGWEWNDSSNPKMVEYHIPLDSTKKMDHCLTVKSGTPNECKVCKEGYQVYEKNCTLAVPLGDDCDAKMGATNITPASAPHDKIQFNNLVILRYMISDTKYKELVDTSCNKCAATKILFKDTSNTAQMVCTNTGVAALTDCAKFDGADAAKCGECDSGKALQSTDQTCVTQANCKLYSSTACTECNAGYALTAAGACALSKCLIHKNNDNTDECLVCMDFFLVDGAEKNVCNNTAAPTDDCKNYSPSLGFCVVHKDEHSIYSAYTTNGGDVWQGVQYEATVQVFQNVSTLSNLYSYDYPYIETKVTYSDTAVPTIVSAVNYVNTPAQALRIYNSGITPVVDHHCFKSLPIATWTNCTTTQGSVCTYCDSNKRMDKDGSCAAITLSDCANAFLKVDLTAEICTSCTSGNFLTTFTCGARSNATNCAGVTSNADTCTSCDATFYLNSSSACVTNTMTNCLDKSRTADECGVCEISYWLKASDKTCNAYTVKYCKEFHKTLDECISCENGYKKKSATNDCEPMEALLCLTFDMSSFSTNDYCATCKSTHMVATGSSPRNCIIKTATNCLTYHTTNNECATCKDNYYLNSSKFCVAKTSRMCLTFKGGYTGDDNMCTTCSDSFKVDTTTSPGITQCSGKVVNNCKTFATGDDEKCAACVNSMFLTSPAGTCTAKTATNCLVFKEDTAVAEKLKCKTCSASSKLNVSTGICDKKDATLCMTHDATDNKCGTCSDGFKLDTGPKNCIPKTAVLCKTWNTTEDKCATCENALYYKGSSDSSCTLNTGTDCFGIKTAEDGCTACKVGWVLNGTNCDKNDAVLCNSFKTDSKNCNDCEADYKFDGTNKSCIAKTAANCLTFSATENKCATCKNGYVLSENDGNCEIQTSDNCLTWNNDKHECVTCSKLHVLNNDKSKCVLKSVKFCKTMDATLNKCLTCEPGFVINTNTGNCDPTSAKNCNVPSTTTHVCTSCPAYFLKNSLNSCDLNEGTNCKVIGDTAKGCKTCALGFVLNSSTKDCDKATKTNCLTYTPDATTGALDQCATCTSSFYKDSNQCVTKTASLCETYEGGDLNKCATCKVGFKKTDPHCVKNTAAGCKTWTAGLDSCTTCSALFWKNGINCQKQTATLCKNFNPLAAGCQDCETEHTQPGFNCVRNLGNRCANWKTDGTGCLNCSAFNFTSGANCVAKSGSMCKDYNTDAVGCGDCANDYTISSSICTKTIKANCDGFRNLLDKCDACTLGFFEHTDFSCKKNEGLNCLTYNTGSNGCNTCEIGYVKNGLNCDLNSAKNCKSYNSLDHKCLQCEALATMNSSDVCVKNNATYCASFSQASDICINCALGWYKNSTTCDKVTAEHCLTFQQNLNRCASCVVGFVYNSVSFVCDANSAQNCLTFKSNEHKCQTCQPKHHKDSSGICQKHTVECKLYDTTANECLSCDVGKFLDSLKKCEPNTASNCDTRSLVANQCLTCINKYWVNTAASNICTQHTAQNCLMYHKTKDECSACLSNVLTNVQGDGKVVCIAYTAQNCNGVHVGSDECLMCDVNSFGTNTTGKLVCTKRTKLNCTTYAENKDECTSCPALHHLIVGGVCTKSLVVPFCSIYEPTADACKICESGYYKDSTNNVCNRFPDGVVRCKEYSSQQQCKYCDALTYLETNTCLPILTAVDGCVRYYSGTHCHTCAAGKLLVDNACKNITATNCELYINEQKCLTCAENHVLQDDKACLSSGIANCFYALKGTAGNVCSICSPGYFLTDDKIKCEAPTTPIVNCYAYESQTKCKQCVVNFILSADQTKCEIIGDLGGANCLQARFMSSPVCDECYFGFTRTKEGVCQKITLASCYLMDTNNEKCELCATGSYMDKDGVCQGTGKTGSNGGTSGTGGTDGGTGGTDGTTRPASAPALYRSMSSLLILLIAFLAR